LIAFGSAIVAPSTLESGVRLSGDRFDVPENVPRGDVVHELAVAGDGAEPSTGVEERAKPGAFSPLAIPKEICY
jgi:hypothetical protein